MKKLIDAIKLFYIRLYKTRPQEVVEKERKIVKKIGKIAGLTVMAGVYVHLLFFLGFSFVCVVLQKVTPKISSLMMIRKFDDKHTVYKVNTVALENVPEKFTDMIVYLEDGHFYDHHGVDIQAIKYAMELNSQYDEPVVGASTLTMQLARTLFLFQKKSYVRKYIEALIALELELFLSKDRIMELYVNSVEWGEGVFGINNAAHYYYGKSPDKLTTDQMMRLATILSSPLRYDVENFTGRKQLKRRYNLLSGIYYTSTGTTVTEVEDPETPDLEQLYEEMLENDSPEDTTDDGDETEPDEKSADDPASSSEDTSVRSTEIQSVEQTDLLPDVRDEIYIMDVPVTEEPELRE